MSFSVGDIVGRKSYGMDIMFKIIAIDERKQEAIIKGLNMRLLVRLLADVALTDLKSPEPMALQNYRSRSDHVQKECITKIYRRRGLEREQTRSISGRAPDEFFELPGKILHLDGDEEYLADCLKAYHSLQLDAVGFLFLKKSSPIKFGVFCISIGRIF